MNIKRVIKQTLVRGYTTRIVRHERRYEESLSMRNISPDKRKRLTDAEQKEVIEMWGGIAVPSFPELEVFKYFNGFDPRYLGHNLYLPLVARRLNDYHYTKYFEDKGLFGCYSSRLRTPECLIRCIGGEFYDNRLAQIGREQAKKRCYGYDGAIIVKPSRESSGGKRIRKIDSGSMKGWFERVAGEYGKDWVAQKCIEQHKSMGWFNPSSVNTLRITSLYLNGRTSICSIILRFGSKGSATDNLSAGGNGIGIHPDGRLAEYALDDNCNRLYKLHNRNLSEIILPFVPQLLEEFMEMHILNFPLCKLIGWDICIDKAENPVVIEINSSQPGIFFEQIHSGPIFGDRTGEVIEYVKTKDFKYNRGLINI